MQYEILDFEATVPVLILYKIIFFKIQLILEIWTQSYIKRIQKMLSDGVVISIGNAINI